MLDRLPSLANAACRQKMPSPMGLTVPCSATTPQGEQCCQHPPGCPPALCPPAGESVTDDGLAHLARLRGSLTALDLGYSCWSHTAPGLAALLQQMTALRMLNIGGWAVAGCMRSCWAAVTGCHLPLGAIASG